MPIEQVCLVASVLGTAEPDSPASPTFNVGAFIVQ